jgi:hypothetical protein
MSLEQDGYYDSVRYVRGCCRGDGTMRTRGPSVGRISGSLRGVRQSPSSSREGSRSKDRGNGPRQKPPIGRFQCNAAAVVPFILRSSIPEPLDQASWMNRSREGRGGSISQVKGTTRPWLLE